MKHSTIHKGNVYGVLTVLEKQGPYALCRCSICGEETLVRQDRLPSKKDKPCRCNMRNNKPSLTHGLSRTPEHRAHEAMLQRCYKPKCTGYENYGGRGITVCDRWRFGEDGKTAFECFLEDMGFKPSPQYQLERKENEGNYEPSNVRWATPKEEARNRRSTKWITIDGVKKSLAEWVEESGLPYHAVNLRISRRGWDPKRALTTPLMGGKAA